MPKNSLVDLLFWLHSGYFGNLHYFQLCNLIHLCQLKLGMENKQNPKQFILKFYIKIWKNTNNYLHT